MTSMRADCPCSRAADTQRRASQARRLARAPWLTLLLSGSGALCLPKCPLCVASYLSLFGVTLSAGAAALAWMRLAGGLALALALVWLTLHVRRRLACRAAHGW